MGDYFSFVFEGINRILTQHAQFFESMGREIFFGLAVVLLSWFGIQSALSSAEGGPGFSWSRFAGLLQELLLVYTMIAFYSVPIPFIGVSFTHLVLDQVTMMVQRLDQARVQELIETLNVVQTNLPFPSAFELLAIIRYIILIACILVAQAVTLSVVLFGYAATAVMILLGPVFIPFKVVPQMEWLFWGWFRAFLQHAFYQVVASAYVFIFGDLLMQILGAKAIPLTTEEVGYLFAPIALILITFILGTIKVPALTFSLFAGRSGDYIFLRWK